MVLSLIETEEFRKTKRLRLKAANDLEVCYSWCLWSRIQDIVSVDCGHDGRTGNLGQAERGGLRQGTKGMWPQAPKKLWPLAMCYRHNLQVGWQIYLM